MSVVSRVIDKLEPARPPELSVLLRGGSMRFLEGGLALLAIVTAILVGQLH